MFGDVQGAAPAYGAPKFGGMRRPAEYGGMGATAQPGPVMADQGGPMHQHPEHGGMVHQHLGGEGYHGHGMPGIAPGGPMAALPGASRSLMAGSSMMAPPTLGPQTEAQSLLASPNAPPGLSAAFGGRPLPAARASLPYLSAQQSGRLLPSEQTGLNTLLQATGTNPEDYRMISGQLSQTGQPPRPAYRYVGRWY